MQWNVIEEDLHEEGQRTTRKYRNTEANSDENGSLSQRILNPYDLAESQATTRGDSKLHIQKSPQETLQIELKDQTANIAPLGLLGFGLTTFLLNLHNVGLFEMSPVVLAMGMCYGGLAQLIAGIFEWIKGNMFTAVGFISYGTFWWSFVCIFAIPKFGWANAANDISLAWYLFIWGIFTLGMLVASFKKPRVIIVIFALLVILFELLAAGKWSSNENVIKAAGVVGIICGLLAIYAGCAEVINELYQRTILPLGEVKKEKVWSYRLTAVN